MEAVDQHKMAAIQRIVEALNTLETQHAEMRAVEKGLNKYGLVQSRFGLLHGGVVERMAQQVTPAIRRDAVHHFRAFRASLSIRIKQPKKAKSKLDAGNQQMLATSGFYRIGRRLTAYESVDACPHRLASSPS